MRAVCRQDGQRINLTYDIKARRKLRQKDVGRSVRATRPDVPLISDLQQRYGTGVVEISQLNDGTTHLELSFSFLTTHAVPTRCLVIAKNDNVR